jgi:2-hydroxy-3-keto-5-methylthiopentenyl-1-phosphate phosphatase
MKYNSIIFCDFDGTITAIETFAGMLKEFAPDLSAQIMPLMYARKLTLREGVRQILESIPSRLYPEIISYAETKPIRPGFTELVDFLNSQNVPLIVISGGLKNMVKAVLSRQENQSLITKISDIFAIEIDTSSDYLKINSDFEAGTELVAKVKVMEQYDASEKIAIGDSLTDINMALKADLVFARDRLKNYLDEENKSYISWENFFDIKNYLVAHWYSK